jgi:DNA-binding MarR family transcriptional regulator
VSEDSYKPRLDGVSYGVLDTLLGYAVRRAQLVIYEDFSRAAGDGWVTPQRFAALVLVAENPGIGQTRLGKVMGIGRSGAMTLVNDLEKRGWISRQADPSDKRANGLWPTREGRDALAVLTTRITAHDTALSDRLDDPTRAAVMGLAERLSAQSD